MKICAIGGNSHRSHRLRIFLNFHRSRRYNCTRRPRRFSATSVSIPADPADFVRNRRRRRKFAPISPTSSIFHEIGEDVHRFHRFSAKSAGSAEIAAGPTYIFDFPRDRRARRGSPPILPISPKIGGGGQLGEKIPHRLRRPRRKSAASVALPTDPNRFRRSRRKSAGSARTVWICTNSRLLHLTRRK